MKTDTNITPVNPEQELAQLKAILADPDAVHVNLLRGTIAMPSVRQMRHVIGDAQYETLEAQRDHYKALCEDMLPFLDRSGPEYLTVARKFDRRFQELESGWQCTTKEGPNL